MVDVRIQITNSWLLMVFMRLRQESSQWRMVCLATSSSIMYSSSSRASNSSSWSDFRMSTERYDNILVYNERKTFKYQIIGYIVQAGETYFRTSWNVTSSPLCSLSNSKHMCLKRRRSFCGSTSSRPLSKRKTNLTFRTGMTPRWLTSTIFQVFWKLRMSA